MDAPAIVRACDAKIDAHLRGRRPGHFWYAFCPGEIADLHARGFDNYPLAPLPWAGLFFLEQLLGATLYGPCRDTFTTWCAPSIHTSADIDALTLDFEHPLWQSYYTAITTYLADTPAAERLPVAFAALCPLDTACSLCGTEEFFLLCHDDPDAARALLARIADGWLAARARVAALGARLRNGYGFPGLYCNDLQLPYLAPDTVRALLLPVYARLAEACGGLMLGLNIADMALMREMLALPGLLGTVFDHRLPLAAIAEHAGDVLFILNHYRYDDTLDRPTARDGAYWNPIVCGFSRELPDVYRAVADRVTMLITIERETLAEVEAVRDELTG